MKFSTNLSYFLTEIFKKNPTKIDNYGIWLRYQDCNCPYQALQEREHKTIPQLEAEDPIQGIKAQLVYVTWSFDDQAFNLFMECTFLFKKLITH